MSAKSTERAASGRLKFWIRPVLICLCVAAWLWLIAQIGPKEIVKQLRTAGLGVSWLFVVYAAGTIVSALPWRWLLVQQARPPLRKVITSRFAASGANAVLPFFGFGGEPLRLMWLREPHIASGAAALIVDRLTFVAASATMLLLAAGVQVNAVELPKRLEGIPTLLALILVAIVGALCVSFARGRIATRLHATAGRLLLAFRSWRSADATPSHAQTGGRFGEVVDNRIQQLLTSQAGRLAACYLTHLIGRALLMSEIYVGLKVLSAPISLQQGVLLAALPVALSLVVSWVPSQVGIQEGALAYACGLMGIAPAFGIAVVLLQRIRQALFVALALTLIWHQRRRAAVAPVVSCDRAAGSEAVEADFAVGHRGRRAPTPAGSAPCE